jgi:TolA-binding protein
MKVRIIALIALVGLAAFALAGCSTEARAERKGKAAGDQICKAKSANNANDAQRHLRRANDKLDDLKRFTGVDVREDIRSLDRNLNQLQRGNGSAQTINSIVRSVQAARADVTGNAAAVYDGMLEALASCD